MDYDNFNNDLGFDATPFGGVPNTPPIGSGMGFNGGFETYPAPGFGQGMPMTSGYSPAPFGCDPVSMNFNGNVCIDGIPVTPNTPPAWMTGRAFQAEMAAQQLEMQLQDPNLWMQFMPSVAFDTPTIDMSNIDWQSMPAGDMALTDNQMVELDPLMEMNPATEADSSATMWQGEEVLPCGLTQSQYDQHLHKYQDLLADCERQLENCDPYHSALRAMIQNNINDIKRNIRDLDKPLGRI